MFDLFRSLPRLQAFMTFRLFAPEILCLFPDSNSVKELLGFVFNQVGDLPRDLESERRGSILEYLLVDGREIPRWVTNFSNWREIGDIVVEAAPIACLGLGADLAAGWPRNSIAQFACAFLMNGELVRSAKALTWLPALCQTERDLIKAAKIDERLAEISECDEVNFFLELARRDVNSDDNASL